MLKSLGLALLLTFGLGNLQAQYSYSSEMYVNGIALSELDVSLIEVTFAGRFSHLGEFGAEVNYGQDCRTEANVRFRHCMSLRYRDGAFVTFQTPMKGLNMMEQSGWKLVDVYTPGEDSPHYVFRREEVRGGDPN